VKQTPRFRDRYVQSFTTIVANTYCLCNRYSVTLLTSLTHELPVFISLRKNSNNQVDFLKFVCAAVEEGYITQGDILVCDNASIHKGKLVLQDLKELQAEIGFQIKFLPTYSPELNPCELVFNVVKGRIRKTKAVDSGLRMAILEAFAMMNTEQMEGFYSHCQENTIALNWEFLKDLNLINDTAPTDEQEVQSL